MIRSNTSGALARLSLIAIGAASACLAIPAVAQAENSPRPTLLIIEGAFDLFGGDEQGYADEGPNAIIPNRSRVRIGPDSGAHGLVSFITPYAGTPYDWGMTLRYGQSFEESFNPGDFAFPVNGASRNINIGLGSGALGRVEYIERHGMFDFEGYREVGADSVEHTSFTASFGVRAAYFGATTGFHQLSTGGLFFNSEISNTFFGLGPVAGIESSSRLSDNVTIDLALDASLLFGVSNREVSVQTNLINAAAPSDDSQFRLVPTVGGSIAVSFAPQGLDSAIFSLGVRGDYWYGAYDQRVDRPVPTSVDQFDFGDEHAHRFSFSPFARLTIPL